MGFENVSLVTEFILLGLPLSYQLQTLIFVILSVCYVVTLVGNATIIIVSLSNAQLHTPMYFFLSNLALLDISFTTAIVPKVLLNLISGNKTISFHGCLVQSYVYFLLGTTEFLLLAIMSFDRYMAICNPLRYGTIMSSKLCMKLIACSWIGGFMDTIVQTVLTFRLPFCGPNVINHYFCDVAPLLKLACAETHLIGMLDFILASFLVLGSLFFSLVSYGCIISAITKISSTAGRTKTFSTCASHLTVVFIVYGSCIFMCVRPAKSSKIDSTKIVALLNSILTPLLNPFIYSFRNKAFKDALSHKMNSKMLWKNEKNVRL
ncbi:olfactory receptor 49-like [Spea bombifrons]|uniref:olfactory receptor 49-like n=1 Tax=Spea bombifrons TaxID=233779 RepID=UPI00234B2FED|nr:olfactory receptor 49-like [Spea bombifrons]